MSLTSWGAIQAPSNKTYVLDVANQHGTAVYTTVSSESSSSPVSTEAQTISFPLRGRIHPGWELWRELWLTIEQDADGTYIVDDDVSVIYGAGDTRAEAVYDYILSLVEYYELCERDALTGVSAQSFQDIGRYVRRVGS